MGYIYYITFQDGMSSIMEGAPKNPYQKFHKSIFEFKHNKILAFNGCGKHFYMLDSFYSMLHLSRERKEGNRRL